MFKQQRLTYKTDIDTLRDYRIYLNSIILEYSDVKIEGLTIGQLQEHLNKLSNAKSKFRFFHFVVMLYCHFYTFLQTRELKAW